MWALVERTKPHDCTRDCRQRPARQTQIAYPNSRHPSAGGSGTVADPLSLATDPREIRPGVLVYYPTVRKYFVMETTVHPASTNGARTAHRTWTCGCPTRPPPWSKTASGYPDDPDTIVVNAPTDLPVDTRPLFNGGRCWPNT